MSCQGESTTNILFLIILGVWYSIKAKLIVCNLYTMNVLVLLLVIVSDQRSHIFSQQSKNIEQEIKSFMDNVNGRISRVFRMKDRVRGSKKTSQEAHAIVDIESKEIIVNYEKVKEKILDYNVKNLKNNEPSENVIELVNTIDLLHELRMCERRALLS